MKSLSIFRCGLVGLFLCSFFLLSSCEGGVGGNAPSSVAGKTMEIRNDEGSLRWTFNFSSNSSASFYMYGYADQPWRCSSIEYKKTGSESATLQIKGAYLDGYRMDGTEDYNYSLIFTSPNQGIVNSRYTFTLF